jgi:hypothetical protein
MKLTELTDLISIRQYVANQIAIGQTAFTSDKKMVRELDDVLLMLDKKILTIITDDEFKELINFNQVKDVKVAAQQASNIYAGLNGRK